LIATLSLHDALPIFRSMQGFEITQYSTIDRPRRPLAGGRRDSWGTGCRRSAAIAKLAPIRPPVPSHAGAWGERPSDRAHDADGGDRKSTRLNSSHDQ